MNNHVERKGVAGPSRKWWVGATLVVVTCLLMVGIWFVFYKPGSGYGAILQIVRHADQTHTALNLTHSDAQELPHNLPSLFAKARNGTPVHEPISDQEYRQLGDVFYTRDPNDPR